MGWCWRDHRLSMVVDEKEYARKGSGKGKAKKVGAVFSDVCLDGQ